MSATNHTTNYELPVFVGTDKPAWLVDWNGAMTAIDTAIHTAEGKADQAGIDIGGIESSISTINSTLTSINSAVSQLRIDTNANTGSINTITSLIGNGLPTTTDKTIIGAINEIVSDFDFSAHTGTPTVTASSIFTLTEGARSVVKYAINSKYSAGKIYGGVSGTLDSSADTWNKIVTLSGLGLPKIDTAYYIEFGSFSGYASGTPAVVSGRLKFNTNGTVDIEVYTAYALTSLNVTVSLAPCIYFFDNFGD